MNLSKKVLTLLESADESDVLLGLILLPEKIKNRFIKCYDSKSNVVVSILISSEFKGFHHKIHFDFSIKNKRFYIYSSKLWCNNDPNFNYAKYPIHEI